MIKTLYVRIILTFLGIIVFSVICSFFIGLYVFQKQISYEAQNEMITVGRRSFTVMMTPSLQIRTSS